MSTSNRKFEDRKPSRRGPDNRYRGPARPPVLQYLACWDFMHVGRVPSPTTAVDRLVDHAVNKEYATTVYIEHVGKWRCVQPKAAEHTAAASGSIVPCGFAGTASCSVFDDGQELRRVKAKRARFIHSIVLTGRRRPYPRVRKHPPDAERNEARTRF